MRAALWFSVFLSFLCTVSLTNAQRVKLNTAVGVSAYYGDLLEGSPLAKQLSAAVTIGGSYDFTEKLRARLTFTGLGVRAEDANNKRQDYKERNLSFKSFIWEIHAAAEYDFLNNFDEWAFTPYIFAGPGIFGFNPTTIDRFGNKVKLRNLGTEGQGMPQYPDRKPYSRVALNFGFGGGIRIDVTEEFQIGTEIFIRPTNTDYIDDVSKTYVAPELFVLNNNSYAQYLAYRGDEVGKTFSPHRPRGNPKNNDLYYSFQIKLTYKLLNVDWGGPLGLYSYSHAKARRAMRNPKSVL